jgi:Flp pilus assembly protein TadG
MKLPIPRRTARDGSPVRAGQAIVEFGIASLLFLTIIFGTIVFGRAIFVSAEIRNAAREGARYGKVNPTDAVNIRQRVLNQSSGTGLTSGNIGVSCTGACKFGDTLTVTTTVQFTAVTQSLLGIGPITLTSSAKVDIE